MTARLVLASQSPRRRAILTEAGLDFDVRRSGVEEGSGEGDPVAVVIRLALEKARDVATGLARGHLVVGADTLVVLGGRILGKARDAKEAEGMLRWLSGSRHEVLTGLALVESGGGEEVVGFERTTVTMRPIADDEIAAYLDSGEWRDKAGAYAIQETGDRFVVSLEGSFDNVVGFPLALFRSLLARLGYSIEDFGKGDDGW